MKTLNQIITERKERFIKEFDYSFCCGGDYCVGYHDHDVEERKHIQDFLEHSIRKAVEEALEAVEVLKIARKPSGLRTDTVMDDVEDAREEGWNAAIQEQDKKREEFLKK